MIMTFGEAAAMLETQDPDWIRGMIQFMTDLDVELRESGELVLGARTHARQHASRMVAAEPS